jgi:hypothetical protein
MLTYRLLKMIRYSGQLFLIHPIDGIRSVKVSGKKVNAALDKELRER